MKEMPASKRSQHQNYHLNNIPKIAKKTVNNVQLYELLRNEYIANNPHDTEKQIIESCIAFAKHCCLALSKNLLEIQLQKLGDRHG